MTEYFAHDYDARNDPKMVQLVIEQGAFGIAVYWISIEILHSSGGQIDRSTLVKMLCHYLHETADKVESCLSHMVDFGLITEQENVLCSLRVLRNLMKRQEVAETRRNAANKRHANAMQMHSISNAQAPKEKKRKVKEKEIKEEKREEGYALRLLAVTFKPPSIEDVQTMFRIRGLPDSEAELFHSYYESQGWVKANGQPVRNWQQLIPSWATKYHKDKGDEQKHKRANGDRTYEPLTAESLTEYRAKTRAALSAAVETFQRDRADEMDGRTDGEAPSVPALRVRIGDKWVDPNATDS